jgi:predicted nucleotidyltransferase
MAKRRYNAGVDIGELVFNKAIGIEAAIKFAPKETPISSESALDAGRGFAVLVRERLDPDAIVLVFGSTIKGTAHPSSDIDVAVVSKKYSDDVIMEAAKLSHLASEISWDIEPHAIDYDDWRKCKEPFIFEVQNTGVAV